MSIRDKVLAAKDIKSEQVYVKEWDVTVEVRGLTGRQRAILMQDVVDQRGRTDLKKLYPQLVALSTYDPETGEPVFQAGDFDAIAEKSASALEAIVNVANRLSGLNGEAEKNSEQTPSGDSTSN